MMKHGFFPFHIVSLSPWPLYLSLSSFSLMSTSLKMILSQSLEISTFSSFMFFILSIFGWFRDITNEGYLSGDHTISVQYGLKMGFLLFLVSEIMFFFSFFWSFFYYCYNIPMCLGGWPPVGVSFVNSMSVPLLGTLLLLTSGVSVTSSHMYIMSNMKKDSLKWLSATILLGLIFVICQFLEYKNNSFTISDSVFGSLFYIMTGFHGLHVVIGLMFISTSCWRLLDNQVSFLHHKGVEFSFWYWHFVDVVWIFLYIFVYVYTDL